MRSELWPSSAPSGRGASRVTIPTTNAVTSKSLMHGRRFGRHSTDSMNERSPEPARGTSRRPTILLVGDTLALGGTEGQFTQLACRLDRKSWDVEVACMRPEGPFLS